VQRPGLRLLSVILLAVVTGVIAVNWMESLQTYTLYRNSVLDETARVHVATFNAEGVDYNHSNCEIAASL